MSDEHIVRADFECPRCDATFDAEVDISEEVAAARREAFEEAAVDVMSHSNYKITDEWERGYESGKQAARGYIRALAASDNNTTKEQPSVPIKG